MSKTETGRKAGGCLRALAAGMALSLLSTLLLLLAAEAGTRLFSDIRPPLTLRDREIGKKYLPGFSGTVFVEESGREVELRFNSDGFRGPDRPLEKEAGLRRVAVLGDSQVAAIATDEAETLVARLEETLNREHPSAVWEVFNFGVSGASTAQELVLYRKLVRGYDPDLVITAFYTGNDLTDNSDRFSNNPRIYMDLDDGGELYVKPLSRSRSTLSVWLNRHSRFYVWQKHRVKILKDRLKNSSFFQRAALNPPFRGRPALAGLTAGPAPAAAAGLGLFMPGGGVLPFLTEGGGDREFAWALAERIIHRFHEEVTAEGRHMLFVVIPNDLQLYEDSWRSFVAKHGDLAGVLSSEYPDRRLREIFRKTKTDHLFLREGLRAFIARRPHTDQEGQVLYGGTGHLNAVGNRLAAQLVTQHLREQGIIAALLSER